MFLLRKQLKLKFDDCLVKLKTQPTWKNGKVYENMSEGFEDEDFNRSDVTTSTSYVDDSMHVPSV